MRDLSPFRPLSRRRTAYRAAATLIAALALASCSSSTTTKTDATTPVTADATTTAVGGASPSATNQAGKTPIGKRTGDCGDAKIAVNVVLNAATDVSNDVTSIDADPGCTELILSTDLDRTAGAQATKLCDAVAGAAFANGFSTVSVRVVGQGHVTAGNFVRAVDGGPCLAV
ncbi:MAG TPA: hypothetical protein VGF84_02525 [Micromonosporaceae bacterium]|jgi:hypothetical protein